MAQSYELAATLAALRTALGLRQKDLAARAGIHFSQLSRYETGLEQPNSAILHRLLEAAEVSVVDFYRLESLLRSILRSRPSGAGARSSEAPPPADSSEQIETDRVAQDVGGMVEQMIRLYLRQSKGR